MYIFITIVNFKFSAITKKKQIYIIFYRFFKCKLLQILCSSANRSYCTWANECLLTNQNWNEARNLTSGPVILATVSDNYLTFELNAEVLCHQNADWAVSNIGRNSAVTSAIDCLPLMNEQMIPNLDRLWNFVPIAPQHHRNSEYQC